MKRQHSITIESWPTLDRIAFLSAIGGGSRRQECHGTRLAPTTIRSLCFVYGQCLGWLADHDCLNPATSPVERWPPAVATAMIDDMAEGYALATIVSRVRHLKRVLVRLAPATDVTHLDQILRQLGKPCVAKSAVVGRVSTTDLVGCGATTQRSAEEGGCTVDLDSRAIVFQTGLQIELLSMRPWRSTPFAKMEIGIHVQKIRGVWRIVADPGENSRKRSSNSPFPEAVIPSFERYLDHWRPILCGDKAAAALWMRPGGQRFEAQHLHYYVSKFTKQHFGFPISPKWFRKIFATTMGRDYPELIDVVGTVLGHADHSMNERFYNLADTVSAFARLANCIESVAKPSQVRRARRTT